MRAANKEWDGSSSLDFNTAANWTPGGVPTADDVAFIRILGANVAMSHGVGVSELRISNGSKLSTMGHLLFVNSTISLTEDAGSVSLTINPGPLGTDVDTDFLTVNTGAELILAGGVVQVDSRITTATGGTIRGFGVIEMATSSLGPEIINDGQIDVAGGTLTVRRAIPASPMRFDLDGTLDKGNILVTDGTSSLLVNAPTRDAMNGNLTVGDGNTVTFNEGWTLGNAAAPLTKGTLTLTGGAAGAATVAGSTSTISGAVNATAGTGRFTTSVAFLSTAEVNVSPSATLSLAGSTTYEGGTYSGTGQISQDAAATVISSTSMNVGVYDMDGLGATHVTISKDATLTLQLNTLDDADDVFDGTLSLNGGSLSVNVAANQWTMAGTLNLTETGGAPGQVLGEKMRVQGAVNVSRTNRIASPVDFLSGANVHLNNDVDRLEVTGAASFAGGSYVGAGELELNGPVTIASDTTISVNVFDLDGAAESTATTINANAKLSIDVDSLEADGNDSLNGPLVLNGGKLDVKVADGSWSLDGPTTLTQTAGAIPQITGNPLEVKDLMTVNGIAEIVPAVDFQSSGGVQLAAANSNLRVNQATLGALYSGPGTLTVNGPSSVPIIASIQCAVFDWDGDTENSTTTIVPGAIVTIGSPQLEDDDGGYDGTTIVGNAARMRFTAATNWTIDTGTLRMEGPTTEFSGTADIVVTSSLGKLEGTGVLAVDVTTAGKTSPGLPTGTLNIAGNFTQQATGLLQIELAGASYAAHDHLDVFGSATLAGTLDVDLIGGYMPNPGDEFTVLTFASRVGDFTYTGLNLGGGVTLTPVFSATSLTLVAMSSALQGDANMDGTVDIFDVNVVSDNWGTNGPTGDVNGDGTVDIFDVNVISDNWTTSSGVSVGEPAAIALAGVVLGGAGMLAQARRRASRLRASRSRP